MENKQGFRNEKEMTDRLESLRSKLTTEELKRIDSQRDFDNIDKDTHTYNIALHLDSLRVQLRDNQYSIMKSLWNIENIHNNIENYKSQLKSNKIVEKLPESDMVMNVNELLTYITHNEWVILGVVRGIVPVLAKIRSLVGHKDYIKQEILTEEDFNLYVEDCMTKLKVLGHDLYE